VQQKANAMQLILRTLKQILTLLAVLLICTACSSSPPSLSFNPWQLVPVPTDSTLLDIAFSSPNHGWLVGTHSNLLETFDGGKTWQPRSLALDDQNYRFTSVSFSGQEGWITGKPSILLHTTDAGRSWSRIPLSTKLPGVPNTVIALGPQSAEMTTDIGAIYRTQDAGRTWKAMVQEAVGVVRNIARSENGRYVAVSARGNFYSTWEPGQTAWKPDNRNSSRRIQSMGFGQNGQLWMLNRGGQLQFSDPEQPDHWAEAMNPQSGVSIGLLDLAYRTDQEIWVAGGSGNLLCSFDGGKTWKKDRAVEDIPSNFYKISFITPEQGFIIGQKGTLLRYKGQSQAA
jgi:photosystem II stability/assembly factor-like uncharacterized protein